MTRSVYVLGGAGTGKSTFTTELLAELPEPGPLTDLHMKPNRKARVTLRGHPVGDGVYLGVLRDWHPGTDGLDRASSQTGVEWLERYDLPRWILAEGATLATRPFLAALHAHTELLLVHLHASLDTRLARFAARGTAQDPSFVRATETRSANRLREAQIAGWSWLSIDTGDPEAWEIGLDLAGRHLTA